MRHGVAMRKLNRDTAHRLAMFRTMVTQLIEHERITTTVAKAKELRRWADKIVGLAKRGDLHARRQAVAILRTPEAVRKAFDVFPDRYKGRNGGYTRVLKNGYRQRDDAPLAIIELVDNIHGNIPSPRKERMFALQKDRLTMAASGVAPAQTAVEAAQDRAMQRAALQARRTPPA